MWGIGKGGHRDKGGKRRPKAKMEITQSLNVACLGYYLYNREQQIYGTYNVQGGGFANIIDDLSEVNRNRFSIGLPSLELKEQRDSINRFKIWVLK